jgi:hypothetical protein
MPKPRKTLTIREVCELLRCGRTHEWKLRKAQAYESMGKGRGTRIFADSLALYQEKEARLARERSLANQRKARKPTKRRPLKP